VLMQISWRRRGEEANSVLDTRVAAGGSGGLGREGDGME
jgi:hypothetical protein